MEEDGNQVGGRAPAEAAVKTKKKKSLKVAILQTFITLTIIPVPSNILGYFQPIYRILPEPQYPADEKLTSQFAVCRRYGYPL